MNKKMIALAVAAAMPMAAAQAAPTVYGVAQVEIVSKDTGATDTRNASDKGAGRIGLKGSEDLGNGLSAVYNLEWGTDTADNTDGSDTVLATSTTASALTTTIAGNTFTSRTSIIGLKGSFGEVTVGRQSSPFARVGLDSTRASEVEARGTSAEMGSASGFGNGSFVSNSIMYSNKFGPVMFRAMLSLDDSDDTSDDSSISFDYNNGPLRVVYAASTDSDGTTDTDLSKIGAQYKLGAWKFTAQMENSDNGTADVDYTMLAADYTMGKNNVLVRMGTKDNGTIETDATAVVLTHKLSKSTKAWVGVTSNETSATAETDITSIGMQVKF